jgi:hypothetical protein
MESTAAVFYGSHECQRGNIYAKQTHIHFTVKLIFYVAKVEMVLEALRVQR